MPYDLFLSCPMAGTKTAARYREVRAQAIRIVECLENECQFRVFFAGRDLEARTDFDEADFSIAKDIRALEESQYFLLFYPERVVSSVLVEAGMALALKKKAVYFVRERRHLPFMLQKVESVAPVKVCEFRTADRVLTLIRNHRRDLFEPWVVGRSAQATACDEAVSGPMPDHDLERRVNRLTIALTEYSQELRLALQYVQRDPGSALTKARSILEKLLVRVYTAEMVQEPRKALLGDMLVVNQFTRKIVRRILSRMNAIRDIGNLGPHGESVEPSDAARALDDLCEVLEWYLGRYTVAVAGTPTTQEPISETSSPEPKAESDTVVPGTEQETS
jgi:hypothetical protein